ncbi:MAG: AMP-binding protein [Alcaligenaceae bacterium]|nr:AMP-binding protein [Alcaligenaceae bacterium]
MTDQYNSLYQSFEWLVPSHFNIADACCHRWASSPHEARQVAIYFEDQVGQLTLLTYGQLSEKVNKLANGFIRMGIQPQDRIAIALQHSAETAVTILAALTVGAIAVPLTSSLISAEYAERLNDSQAKVAIVDKHSIAAVMSAIDNHSSVKQIIGIHTEDERIIPWRTLLARQPGTFTPVIVSSDSPALLIYPDPKENKPLKGTLLHQSALIGTLPGFVASQNWFPKGNDIFWTSFDWSTPHGLLNALLPTLYFGRSIVGCPAGRTIPRLFTLLEHYQITNMLVSSYELNRIKNHHDPLLDFKIAIRCISCPDTEVTNELREWVKSRFDVTINSIFAPLGFGYIIGESHEKWPSKPESIGKPYPGHTIAIINENGDEVEAGQIGEIAIHTSDQHDYPDPGISLSYWSNAQIHDTQKNQEWILTGVRGYTDQNNYFWRAPESTPPELVS